MKRTTYYIVQTGEYTYSHYDSDGFYSDARGEQNATHFDLAKARQVYDVEVRLRGEGSPRRFPRIIKVTTEYKTITTNRR